MKPCSNQTLVFQLLMLVSGRVYLPLRDEMGELNRGKMTLSVGRSSILLMEKNPHSQPPVGW